MFFQKFIIKTGWRRSRRGPNRIKSYLTQAAFKIEEKATNLTTSVKDSIKNAKKNIKNMVEQVKCVKNKIVKKVYEKKFGKTLTYYDSYSQNNTDSMHNRRNSEYFNLENLKQKLNFSQITNKFNISGIKNKLLKLVQLEDCFEVKEEKYGFRTKVTLVENSPCILGSTCRGEPYTGPDVESMTAESSSIQNKVDNYDLIQNYLDDFERQSGEEFSSDGPPDCRVIRNSQCDANG